MDVGLFFVIFSALTCWYMEPHMVNKMVKGCGYFKIISVVKGSRGFPLQAFESLSNESLNVSALGALIHI